jgi:hypothetical protein
MGAERLVLILPLGNRAQQACGYQAGISSLSGMGERQNKRLSRLKTWIDSYRGLSGNRSGLSFVSPLSSRIQGEGETHQKASLWWNVMDVMDRTACTWLLVSFLMGALAIRTKEGKEH